MQKPMKGRGIYLIGVETRDGSSALEGSIAWNGISMDPLPPLSRQDPCQLDSVHPSHAKADLDLVRVLPVFLCVLVLLSAAAGSRLLLLFASLRGL